MKSFPEKRERSVPYRILFDLIAGGGERRRLRIAAKHANISHLVFSGPTDDIKILYAKLSALRKHCEAVGKDYDEISVLVSRFLRVAPNLSPRRNSGDSARR
jgi:alkanesulfonate monooxygenase SsuD/methylene tetrahydromethanopterin reductase-like flavin-dependent oxidoreductase (luciferase family)